MNKTLGKYSFGIGDRFAHQGSAQLSAFVSLKSAGVDVTPVWNKSYREHTIIKSSPATTRQEADKAVKELGWEDAYFVDADHVTVHSVDFFMDSSDFFTLDVAEYIGQSASETDIQAFIEKNQSYLGEFKIPGIPNSFFVDQRKIEKIARTYLKAIKAAGETYRRIAAQKPKESYVVEVSMDETDEPQTPLEILFILSGLAAENVPVHTLAPKFSGRFNKGVDYVGNLNKFASEFEQDVLVLQWAVKEFNLPDGIKLSVHSGSDKFSLYPIINEKIRKWDTGLHLKTAGTTWLEELIGLAKAGGSGLQTAKDIYKLAYNKRDELIVPYASVIDIDPAGLPTVEQVTGWQADEFAAALRHDPDNNSFNPHFRQLLHVGYKIAAEMGERYISALKENAAVIAANVKTNILDRHLKPLFLNKD